MRKLAAVLFALLLAGVQALASQATLVTPAAPLPMSGLASFLNAAFLSVGSCQQGNTAPANGTGAAPFAGECWANNTTTSWPFAYYDGASWVTFGTLDSSGHRWTPNLGTSIVSGAIPYGGSATTINWTAALTLNGVLLGGGAGGAPTATAAAGAADKVFGAWSGDPGSYLSINNCTGGLTYSTSTHTFGCNVGAGSGTVTSVAQGANTTANPGAGVSLSTNPCVATCTVTIDASYMKGHINGCTISAPGGATTLTITACVATSDDATTLMKTASTFTKTMAAWAVGTGNGGLDTGAIAASTWYYAYEIIRTDTGVVDFLISTSASAPSLPTNYTKQRLLQAFKTDATPNIVNITCADDRCYWPVMVRDVNAQNIGTTATSFTVSVPPISGVVAYGVGYEFKSSTASAAMVYSPLVTDQTVAYGTFENLIDDSAGLGVAGEFAVPTNNGQVRFRGVSAGVIVDWDTKGWFLNRRDR